MLKENGANEKQYLYCEYKSVEYKKFPSKEDPDGTKYNQVRDEVKAEVQIRNLDQTRLRDLFDTSKKAEAGKPWVWALKNLYSNENLEGDKEGCEIQKATDPNVSCKSSTDFPLFGNIVDDVFVVDESVSMVSYEMHRRCMF